MHMKYGKVVFGHKDVFELSYTLRPIIHAGLVKFKDTLVSREEKGAAFGVPIFEEIEGGHMEESLKYWFEILDKMIYAFDEKTAPDIMKYDIGFPKDILDIGKVPVTNPEGLDKYWEDCLTHRQKVDEGLRLFAKHYEDLWW